MWGQINIAIRSIGTQSTSMMSAEHRPALFAELLVFAISLKNQLRDEATSRDELGTLHPTSLTNTVPRPSLHLCARRSGGRNAWQGRENHPAS